MKRLVLVFVLLVQACSHVNEGAVDFRKGVVSSSTDNASSSSSSSSATSSRGCIENCVSLLHKNKSLDAEKINTQDSISIHLVSAYIADFSEFFAKKYFKVGRQFNKEDGEIAIVADAFEMENGREIKFSDTKSGRLVFYSDNVHKGQFLNFDNMPIYGPINYKGYPFAFRVSIFELDSNNQQSKFLLSTLASYGGKAFPPSAPYLSVLNGLGNSIFSDDGTDTEFKYTMILDQKNGNKQVDHLLLQQGYYVFVRKENREKPVNWDNLYLNSNDGRLYREDTLTLFTESTYLVVEINKNVSDHQLDLEEKTYAELLTVLAEEDAKKTQSLEGIKDSLNAPLLARQQVSKFNSYKKNLVTVESYLKSKSPGKMVRLSVMRSYLADILEAIGNVDEEALNAEQKDYLHIKLYEVFEEKISASNWGDYTRENIAKKYECYNDETCTQDFIGLVNVLLPDDLNKSEQ